MGALTLEACVVIPTPEHGLLAGRGSISEAGIASFEPARTMVSDVLLRLGEPSAVLQGGRLFLYHWQTIGAYFAWAMAAPYGSGGSLPPVGVLPLGRTHLLLIEFDEQDRLVRVGRLSFWIVSSLDLPRLLASRVERWIAAGRHALP